MKQEDEIYAEIQRIRALKQAELKRESEEKKRFASLKTSGFKQPKLNPWVIFGIVGMVVLALILAAYFMTFYTKTLGS